MRLPSMGDQTSGRSEEAIAAVHSARAAPGIGRPWLMLVTGRDLIPGAAGADGEERLLEVIAAAARGGVDLAQLREKDLEDDRLAALARNVRTVLPATVRLIVNGSAAAAAAGQADGVHLPENAVGAAPKEMIVGRSIHSLAMAVKAVEDGADYLIAGSIYETLSHPGAPGQGAAFLQAVCRSVSVPVLAIGGITPQRVPDCLAAGAAGVAVRSPILTASSPEQVAREYRAALDRFVETLSGIPPGRERQDKE